MWIKKPLTSALLSVVLMLATAARAGLRDDGDVAGPVTPPQTTAITRGTTSSPTTIASRWAPFSIPRVDGSSINVASLSDVTTVNPEGPYPATRDAGNPGPGAWEERSEVPTADTALPDTEPPVASAESCMKTAFLADVTIPDGTIVKPGETFTKVWRIQNAGTCEWRGEAGELVWTFIGGHPMDGPVRIPIVAPIPPGGEYEIAVELTAPVEAGQYEGRWQVYDSSGNPIGVPFWVRIKVPGKAASLVRISSPPPDVADWPGAVFGLINGERARYGLPPLIYSQTLALAAQRHAEDCYQRGLCSHIGSDGSDEKTRVMRVGYPGINVDESWVWARSPQAAVHWWLDEEPPYAPHRRMLLSNTFTEVGVGVAPARQGFYFVAVFGHAMK